jgi:hypothetical protein
VSEPCYAGDNSSSKVFSCDICSSLLQFTICFPLYLHSDYRLIARHATRRCLRPGSFRYFLTPTCGLHCYTKSSLINRPATQHNELLLRRRCDPHRRPKSTVYLRAHRSRSWLLRRQHGRRHEARFKSRATFMAGGNACIEVRYMCKFNPIVFSNMVARA